MGCPFEVGGKYRNRKGQYVVEALDGDKMTIRYVDGGLLDSTVQTQARIWRNIQTEEEVVVKPTRERGAVRRGTGRKRLWGQGFRGLESGDFQKGVTGTSWRSRPKLGGLLARKMSELRKLDFESYAIYHRAEVHIAQAQYYRKSESQRKAKFVFRLDHERAHYGFYIERSQNPMGSTWHWPSFVASLAKESDLQGQVSSAMQSFGLHWDVCLWDESVLAAQVAPAPDGVLWQPMPNGQDEELSWKGFATRLQELEPESWCDLYLGEYVPKDRAIAEAVRLANRVTAVYDALMPLYAASVG